MFLLCTLFDLEVKHKILCWESQMPWLAFWGSSFNKNFPWTLPLTRSFLIRSDQRDWLIVAHRPSSQWGQKWEYEVTLASLLWPVQGKQDAVNYCRRFTVLVSACLSKCYTCGSQALKLPNPLTLMKRQVDQPSPEVCSPCQRNGVVVVCVMKL